MTQEQIKAKAKEYFPNDEFKQHAIIDAINWATKELEAENEELKKLKRECETSLCRAEYQYNYEQLTKAKEIIKEFVEWANWQGNSKCPSFKSIQDKAEQFLNSEVEK